MPPIERDVPSQLTADRTLRHQHSSSLSDHSRALVPMWDSSDPDRAPPPLPLNPQSPSVGHHSPSKPGVSAAIQSAHAALTEKARESALISSSLTKRVGEISPIKNSPAHRRMQSLQSLHQQPSSLREFGLALENGTGGRDSVSSTPRSSEKYAAARDPFVEYQSRTPELDRDRDGGRQQALSLSPGPSLTPILRPIARRSTQSILGENTPPQSATMLAIQNMSTPTREKPVRELPVPQPASVPIPVTVRELPEPTILSTPLSTPLSNVTNNVTNNSSALVRQQPQPQPSIQLDSLSQQILGLTSIATSLQKEMAQLSRRSRDNATDLLSLREATNTRDEDIRKSLRDLVNSTQEISKTSGRDPYGAGLLLDNKPNASPSMSKAMRPFTLPRIPSPNSFSASLDGDRMSTPSLCSSDGAATIGMLEKIMRDMGTKEGQNLLVGRLSEIAEKISGMATAAKVEELLRLVRTSQDQSIVFAGGSGGGGRNNIGRPRNYSFDDDPTPGPLEFGLGRSPMPPRGGRLMSDNGMRPSSAPPTEHADIVSEDILKIIRTVKDSVAQGGGLTAEVKALVRELRGEVLGMGRDIGRRLDEVQTKKSNREESVTSAEMARVVEEGLEEMKQHMNQLLREHRRQSAASIASRGPVVDYAEVYNSMRSALKDSQATNKIRKEEITREDVMRAVQDAWETYKPDIKVEHIGLEREEILDCLQEGLRQYAPQQEVTPGATRDEVFKAVIEGLKHYVPPQAETPVALSRDEILDAVRECLEEFEFPVVPSAMGAEITKKDMVEAVREGLESMDLPQPPMPLVPLNKDNDEIRLRLREIMDFMREEFRAVSEEAKQSVAAGGRDTEQVLGATKDGFDRLRTDMESYVDRAASANGQEQFLEGLVRTLDLFREEIAELVSKSTDSSREVLRGEIENLRDTVNSSLVPMSAISSNNNSGGNNKEVLKALHEGLNSIRTEMANRPIAGTNEVLDALQEGLDDVRLCIEKMANKPSDLTANDEILDALRSGLDGVRSDIGEIRELGNPDDKAIATLDSTALVPLDVLRQDDIKNLELLITQLSAKVESIEPASPPATQLVEAIPQEDVSKDDDSVVSKDDSVVSKDESVASKDESILSKGESVSAARALPKHDDGVSKDDISGIIAMLTKLQETVAANTGSGRQPAATDAATREDVVAIETILRNAKSRLDDLMDGEQAVRKDHIDNLEAILLESKETLAGIKSKMDSLKNLTHKEDLEKFSQKEDLKEIESLIAQVANEFEEMRDRHDKQFDDPERVTKTHVEAIETVCRGLKAAIDEMAKTDLAALPNKEDLQKLEEMLGELRDKTVADAEATSKALVDRQAETVGVNESVKEVKSFLEEFQSSIKQKLEDGATGIDSLGKMLEGISETAGKSANVSDDLKIMFEAIKLEFDESRAGVVGAKIETDEKFEQTAATVGAKIDEKFAELLNKYDAFQLDMEERAKNGEVRDVEIETTVLGAKAVADELKTLIDTLGSAVTDSLEKMEEASKTVFSRVEDLVGKAEENHAEGKAEHQLTREEVKRAVGTVEGLLQEQASDFQPKILDGIKDLLLIVGQHFEHSKNSTETIQEKIVEAKPEPLMLPPPPEKYDDTQVIQRLDRLSERYNGSTLLEKLESLSEKCDSTLLIDNQVVEKLDSLSERYNGATLLEKLESLNDKSDATLLIDKQVVEKLESLSERYKGATVLEKLEILDGKCDATLVNDGQVMEKLDSLSERYNGHTLLEKLESLDEKCDITLLLSDKLDTLTDKCDSTTLLVNDKIDSLADKCEETALSNGEKIDKLSEIVVDEKAVVHEKLDRLVAHVQTADTAFGQLADHTHTADKAFEHLIDHTHTADKAFARLETLDKVHQQVRLTAAEVTAFVAAQTMRIADEREEREKTLQETNLAIERNTVRREALEENVARLHVEQEELRRSVQRLREEQEEMLRQRTRLSADVASLETAVSLRREELREVEDRAQGLERRILEGVMDHSRVLLMAKAGGGFSGKRRDAMSRKRVSSQRARESLSSASALADGDATPKPASRAQEAKKARTAVPISMAMNATPRSSLAPANNNNSSSSSQPARRIVSLSQINNNVAAGGFKRSQSVRQPGGRAGMRKSSWSAPVPAVPALHAKGYGELHAAEDKENSAPRRVTGEQDEQPVPVGAELTPPASEPDGGQDEEDGVEEEVEDEVEEEVEEDVEEEQEKEDDAASQHSETNTLRRSSLGTTVITGAESSVAGTYDGSGSEDDDGEYDSERNGDFDDTSSQWTASVVDSGIGSSIGGSELSVKKTERAE